jgi:cell division protease FtsH
MDVTQLDDLMAGREPNAPKEWTPRIPPSGSDDAGAPPAVKVDPEPNAA